MRFSIQNPPRGDQLAAEIQDATGLDVAGRLTFYPPSEIEIPGEDVEALAAQVQGVISAHEPVQEWTDEEKAESTARQQIETVVTKLRDGVQLTHAEQDKALRFLLQGALTTAP